MSEQPTTQQETAETPAPEAPKFDASTLDEFGQQFVARTSAQIEKFNSVVADIKANSTDANEIAEGVHSTLKNAEMPDGLSDKRITKAMLAEYDQIVKREVELDMLFREVSKEYAAKKAAEGTDAEKVAALTAERDALDKKIKQSRNLLATEYPGAETLLPEVARKSGTGTSTGSGRGAGGRKIRGFAVSVDDKVAELNGKSSFAAAATTLGIPTPELQTAYFAAVGTDDVEKLPATATFTVKGKDEKDHTVTAAKNAE
jgi:hypothetical protein